MKKIIKHIFLINQFYKKHFKKNAKIAITGLNPHCESNFKNSEEKRYIKPAINTLIKKNYKIKGPFPADTSIRPAPFACRKILQNPWFRRQ